MLVRAFGDRSFELSFGFGKILAAPQAQAVISD
jgi:hypothetical protein